MSVEQTTRIDDTTPTAAPAGLSRRGLVRAGAAAGAVASVPVLPGPAEAAYRPRRWSATPVPSGQARHMGDRFAYGITPKLRVQMNRAGGPEKWFLKQLHPARISDRFTDGLIDWWPHLAQGPAQLWSKEQKSVGSAHSHMADYARWTMMRRIYSNRQVLEQMTEFWENHLYIPIHDDGVWAYRVQYGTMLRARALGRFSDMLYAAITHPAMGISLDNAKSTKKGINENLGRELLELHTVGVGSYTERDVQDSARILTGYRVDTWETWKAYYDTAAHDTGPVRVMEFSHANASADGRACARAYLNYLARHPRTAHRIARKLALRFVSDNPSDALVNHLAGVYLRNNTEIRPVLRALVRSQEFKRSVGKKVRTPSDDIIATHRVLRSRFKKPRSASSAANAILWQSATIGHAPFDWPRPDGPPDDAAAWTSSSRMLASFQMHWATAGGWWPSKDIAYPSARAWLAKPGMRFDQLVDHLCRVLLGRRSSSTLLKACCQGARTKPYERIGRDHPLILYRMPLLLATILDTPDHFSR